MKLISHRGQHLSLSEQIKIQSMNRHGFSNRYVVKQCGLSPDTINKENISSIGNSVNLLIKKKPYSEFYFAETGQPVYQNNRERYRKPYVA